jgi:diaminopropionate ammonia-lyase
MRFVPNRFRAGALPFPGLDAMPFPAEDAAAVTALLARCPAHGVTPLAAAPDLARRAGVAQVWVKDERGRMGLGSFKALGAAHVIAADAVAANPEAPEGALAGTTYVTASAGNHGLSVAAGARVFGARAVVYLSEAVPEGFAERLRAKGAEVRRAGATYEDSMAAAAGAAQAEGMVLLSDSSWPGYSEKPHGVMAGYLALMAEVAAEIAAPPTHILVQAGVGGLAAAVAAHARRVWGSGPVIAVVEPVAAPAIFAAIAAGTFVRAEGPVSSMGRLDCKEASLIALKGLARDADLILTVTEAEVAAAMPVLAAAGLATTPSGGAGLAALMALDPETRAALGLTETARVLAFLSEGPEA